VDLHLCLPIRLHAVVAS